MGPRGFSQTLTDPGEASAVSLSLNFPDGVLLRSRSRPTPISTQRRRTASRRSPFGLSLPFSQFPRRCSSPGPIPPDADADADPEPTPTVFFSPVMEIEQLKHQLGQWVRQQPVEKLYVSIAVGVLTCVLFILFTVRWLNRSKSNTIVLAGLTSSGKTTLFYQLRDGSSHQGTVISMEPNDDTFVLHSEADKKRKLKPVRVVDVPGHSRLRPKLDEYLPQAAGLVFVVDALDFLQNCRAAAEFLYDILTKASVVKREIPILIVCNKSDKVTAHSKEFIKKQLEKEIDKLRTSRTAISSADIANDYTLGVPGEAFSFSQCQNKVAVAEASGLTGEVAQIEQFIREYVKP